MLVALVGHLLRLRQEGLDLAEVEQRVAVVALLDDAGDDVTLAARVLLVLAVALGLADALGDDLAGGLGGDAAEVVGRVVPLARDVALLVQLLAVDADLTRVGVDGDDRLLRGLGQALVGGDEGVRERVEQRVDRDPLLGCDLLECLEEVEIHAHAVSVTSLSALCRVVPLFLRASFGPSGRARRAVGDSVPASAARQSKTVWARSISP